MSQDLRIMESTRIQSFWKWAELSLSLYNISYCAQKKCSLNVCWKNEQLPPKHQGSTEGRAATHSQSFWVIFILQEKMKHVLASWKGRKNLWEGGCHYPSWNGARLKLSSDLKKKMSWNISWPATVHQSPSYMYVTHAPQEHVRVKDSVTLSLLYS